MNEHTHEELERAYYYVFPQTMMWQKRSEWSLNHDQSLQSSIISCLPPAIDNVSLGSQL